MAPYSSTLAWKIPWMEEPGRLCSMGLLRVGHDWATSLSLFTFMHWRRKWQPTPVFLTGESQGREPGGLPSMGSHRVRRDWSDLAAAACCLLIVSSAFTRTYRNFQLGFKTSPLIDMGYVCQESPWQCWLRDFLVGMSEKSSWPSSGFFRHWCLRIVSRRREGQVLLSFLHRLVGNKSQNVSCMWYDTSWLFYRSLLSPKCPGCIPLLRTDELMKKQCFKMEKMKWERGYFAFSHQFLCLPLCWDQTS